MNPDLWLWSRVRWHRLPGPFIDIKIYAMQFYKYVMQCQWFFAGAVQRQRGEPEGDPGGGLAARVGGESQR